jgi:uracil-DNA glycosylase
VLEGRVGQRALLIGQSPGSVEGAEGRPWRGRAGRTLRAWLGLDELQFYDSFYCTSITRCYPGKSPSGRGDRLATPTEIHLCRFWLEWELRLLQPSLVVTVGGLAARRVLGLSRLTEHVGTRVAFEHAVAIPLPHPSGASGWLNDERNRARLRSAVRLVAQELAGMRPSEATGTHA